jgi:hypothetical protein
MLLLLLLVALVAAACIGQDEVRDEPSPTPVASVSAPPSSQPPTEPSPTAPVTPAPTASPAEAATPTPTAGTSDAPSPSGEAGSADACSGNDDNRTFFAEAARDVAWPVYCAVLPERWFVDGGTYRTSGGGWLEIAYQGPNGARFELHQGAFCEDADGCVPDGPDTGTAAFGDLSGTLVTGNDGRYAVVVDRGQDLSWVAIGDGLDAQAFEDLAADLLLVEE